MARPAQVHREIRPLSSFSVRRESTPDDLHSSADRLSNLQGSMTVSASSRHCVLEPTTSMYPARVDETETTLSLEFDRIFKCWSERVANWARALGAPPSDVDDLVQDVFVVVHRRLPYFDGRNVAAWLYQIVRRQVRDFRRLNWTNLMAAHSVPLSKNLCKFGPSPADRLETKEKTERLERALSKLNPDQRAAFLLLEIEGYSGEEIAQLQSVPVNTVWSRISTARRKLNARL
jgi:RNA polymerase sigma-70 factor (ECF subfamily)